MLFNSKQVCKIVCLSFILADPTEFSNNGGDVVVTEGTDASDNINLECTADAACHLSLFVALKCFSVRFLS